MDIVERLTILLSCIDKDDEEMRGAWETVEDAADEIKRLREELKNPVCDCPYLDDVIKKDDKIERVRKDRNRLREALKEIATEEYIDPKMIAEEALWYSKAARAALKDGE